MEIRNKCKHQKGNKNHLKPISEQACALSPTNALNEHQTIKQEKEHLMPKNDVVVMITASRKKGELEYKVDCSSSITNEEFEYYLGEIIKGICEWKPAVCEENMRSHSGTIKLRKKMKSKLA